MNYPSIRIEGSILTGDVIETVATGDRQDGQRAQDFNFPTGTAVKDEIADAWASARAFWTAYQSKIERLRDGASGVTETRNLWISPLLGLLGYTPELSGKGEVVNQKNYAISHRDTARDGFPIHIMGWFDSLDKKRQDSGPRMSPHALVQEYINLTEHLYAVVTNGRQLRLLRDSSRLIKLSFLEFDLERIFNEELFADFALLFRLLHASRMPVKQDAANESIIERYHQDALDSGSRIRDGLSQAVEICIRDLANGFLSHEANHQLREAARNVSAANGLYQSLLRLIYRMLFLMVIEERGLVYPAGADARMRTIYERYYSIGRLRKLAEKRHFAEEKYYDAWDALCATFRLYSDPQVGEKLGIAPLGGLFHRESIGLLAECRLSNAVLLTAIRRLSYFQHPDTKQYLRVNYGALNVEEFGSVYEGLLEYDAKLTEPTPGKYEFHLVEGEGRAASGSHYTPDELVQPLLKHSIDYLIADKIKESDPQAALLSLRVADIACGSGHILLAAARRIGTELAIIRTGEDQPSPSAMRIAVRDVIQNCIYGVDLNPLAVELCKVALWLEAHVPGQPLNFLDHHIKCGNAIVGFVHQEELEKGIPMEAFKTLPGDDKEVAAALRKRNKEGRADDKRQAKIKLSPENQRKLDEIRQRWQVLSGLPETTPTEIEEKRKQFRRFSASEDAYLLQQIAAIPIAQFYQPKTLENRQCVITEQDYRDYLTGRITVPTGQATASAWAIAHRKKFFHWFLEFPEVMQSGGFDCILGNPPYMGGILLSGTYGYPFCEYCKWEYAPTGLSDLIVFFVRRISSLLKTNGFTAFITTNSIKDGDIRKDGLEEIVKAGATINFAIRGIKWPGGANLVVSLLSIYKGEWRGEFVLDGQPVKFITPFFEDSIDLGEPYELRENEDELFAGYDVLGDGFFISHKEALYLLESNIENNEVVFPSINGQELNNSPDQNPGRSVINFLERSLDQAKSYEAVFSIVRERVKPFRDKQKRKRNRDVWWLYNENRAGLRRSLSGVEFCFGAAATSKYLSFSRLHSNIIFTHAVKIFTTDRWDLYTIVQSTLHEVWARKYSGSLETRLRYSPSDCFSTFAFPSGMWNETNNTLADIGERYHKHRKETMQLLWLGLTKTYNLFHDPELSPEKVAKASVKSKEISQQGYEALLKLRELHVEMDAAVRDAYGWFDLNLGYDFHDLDYLPENDRTRYTISPDARKEVLQRLLKLNHERYAEEKAAGLHDKKAKKAAKKKATKPKSNVIIPDDDLFSPKRLIPEISLPAAARERGLSDGVWWTRFVYEFIREAGTDATLPRLDAAWQLLAQRKLYESEWEAVLGNSFKRWDTSLQNQIPVQGFFDHVVTLHENDLIKVTPNTWEMSIPAASQINQFADAWSNTDVKVALSILESRSDLIPTGATMTEATLVTVFETHFKIA